MFLHSKALFSGDWSSSTLRVVVRITVTVIAFDRSSYLLASIWFNIKNKISNQISNWYSLQTR